MRVIILKDCQAGKAEDVVEVSPGFGRNFLIAKGLAILATKENLVKLEERMKSRSAEKLLVREDSLRLKERIEALKLVFKLKRQGESISNSISTKQIVSQIEAKLGVKLARYTFESVRLREIGYSLVPFKLAGGVEGEIRILIETE